VGTSRTIVNAGKASNYRARTTIGGEGALFTQAHQPILSLKRVGNGALIFSADGELFFNTSLGSTGTMPNEMQLRLYRVIYALFSQVEQCKPSEPTLNTGL